MREDSASEDFRFRIPFRLPKGTLCEFKQLRFPPDCPGIVAITFYVTTRQERDAYLLSGVSGKFYGVFLPATFGCNRLKGCRLFPMNLSSPSGFSYRFINFNAESHAAGLPRGVVKHDTVPQTDTEMQEEFFVIRNVRKRECVGNPRCVHRRWVREKRRLRYTAGSIGTAGGCMFCPGYLAFFKHGDEVIQHFAHTEGWWFWGR